MKGLLAQPHGGPVPVAGSPQPRCRELDQAGQSVALSAAREFHVAGYRLHLLDCFDSLYQEGFQAVSVVPGAQRIRIRIPNASQFVVVYHDELTLFVEKTRLEPAVSLEFAFQRHRHRSSRREKWYSPQVPLLV